jgi:hypothetical protein
MSSALARATRPFALSPVIAICIFAPLLRIHLYVLPFA